MVHIPLIRRGRSYRSIDVARIPHHATRETVAEISQANVGLIRRDLLDQDAMRASLMAIPVTRLMEMTKAAAHHFVHDTLPLGDQMQSQHAAHRFCDGKRARHFARPHARP
jgi:hypothetical protein